MKIREGRKSLSKTFASRGCPCITVVELVETTTFSVALITFGTAPCRLAHVATLASGFDSRFLSGGLSNKFVLRWLSLSKPPHLV